MSFSKATQNGGAIAFESRPDSPSGISDATMFTSPGDSLVDKGWNSIFAKLETFVDYEDDWDGMDALAPEPEVLRAAQFLAKQLCDSEHPAPDGVVVTCDGTIAFETGPFPIDTIEVLSDCEAEHWQGGDQLGTYTIRAAE